MMNEHNEKNLNRSIANMNKYKQMPIVMCNMPALLLRKKTKQYPEGRTSYRFKKQLRDKITIIGKSAFDKPKDPNAPVTFSEADLPETADASLEHKKSAPKAHHLTPGMAQPTGARGRGKKGKGGMPMNHDYLNSLW